MSTEKDRHVLLTLNWRWKYRFENISILERGKQVGLIPDFNKRSISRIYGRSIELERQGLLGQHIYFNDPVDNKAYCQYEYDKITSPGRTCIIIDHILCEIIQGAYKPEYKRIAELNVRKNFFGDYKDAGELLFYDTDHLTEDVFALFFDLYYNRHNS